MTVARLWLCADLSHPAAAALPARVARALEAGAATVWLRSAPDATARAMLDALRAMDPAVRSAGASVFVGDRADVALAWGAAGVHLPERGYDPSAIASWPLRRSRAVHDVAGARRFAGSVDALLASPFGAVPGKGAPLGEAGLREIVAAAGATPVIALGGVDAPETARRCLAAGAFGVAVRRALLDVDDPYPVCVALQRALAQLTAGADPCDAGRR
jgi:thiamine monophosphate synthase